MLIEEIIEEWRRSYSIQKVAKRLRIPRNRIRNLLLSSYNCKNIFILRKKMKIENLLSDNKIARLKQVKELYEKFLTLQKTADQLNISRERVRQLLNKGKKYGLFQYKPSQKTKFKRLLQIYDKKSLVKEIELLKYPSIICGKLHIKYSTFKKLVKHYNINYKVYYLKENLERKKSKYLAKYSQIVDTLGHHPTTTEMHTNKEWKTVYRMIQYHWASIANFRRTHGIEKPIYRMSLLRQKSCELQKKRKQQKVQSILELIKNNNGLSKREIAITLNMNENTLTNHYLVEMHKKGLIEIINKGRNCKYVVSRYYI